MIHVMRYAGDLSSLAKQFAERIAAGKHRNAIDEALAALLRRFCDAEGVDGYLRDGPVSCGMFAFGPGVNNEEDRILEQRNVCALVTEFLRMVNELRAVGTSPLTQPA